MKLPIIMVVEGFKTASRFERCHIETNVVGLIYHKNKNISHNQTYGFST